MATKTKKTDKKKITPTNEKATKGVKVLKTKGANDASPLWINVSGSVYYVNDNDDDNRSHKLEAWECIRLTKKLDKRYKRTHMSPERRREANPRPGFIPVVTDTDSPYLIHEKQMPELIKLSRDPNYLRDLVANDDRPQFHTLVAERVARIQLEEMGKEEIRGV